MQNRNHFHRAFKDKRTSWSRLFSMQPNYRWKLCSCEQEARWCLKRGERLWSLKTRMFAAIFTLAHTKDYNVVDAALWITRSLVTLANVTQCGMSFCKFWKILRLFLPNLSNLSPFVNFLHFLVFCTMAFFCSCYAFWNFCVQGGNLLWITRSVVTLANVAQCGISFCKFCKILRLFFCQSWAICHLL